MDKARDAFVQIVAPEIDETQFNVVLGLETATGDNKEEIDKTLGDLSKRDFPVLIAVLSLQSEMNQITALLREVTQISVKERLVPARERFTASKQRVMKAVGEADKVMANPKRKAATEALLAFGEGNQGFFKLREDFLASLDTSRNSLTAANAAARDMTALVERFVAQAGADAKTSTEQTRGIIAQNSMWLAAIGLGSVLVGILMALLYVRPMIVGRLRKLWIEAGSIARGSLTTEVDDRGNDEIADYCQECLAVSRECQG